MENDIRQQYNKEQIENNISIQNDDINFKNKNNIYENKNILNNSDNLNLFEKYKFQNIESIDNDINTKEKEIIKKNDDYTNQINEIISKNFKQGLNMSENFYFNNNNNNSKNKYLELDKERKLLLLKNIELEKEINNLNNFVDIGSKFCQNKIIKKNIESYNNKKNNIKENKNKNCKKEINEAQNTIKILDKKINELKEKINMNYSLNNLFKYQDKIKEVKIWRETFYEEFFKYKNLLKDLKNNLNKDKIIYNEVITKMKEKATDNINNIYENYKNQIIDNDKKLNFLKKENEKLISKENKVKEIYLYNFN
jgi:hypothetical protein